MIVLIRSNDANPDPRLQKYINYLDETHQKYLVIAWNRDKGKIIKDNYIYFNKEAQFGLRYKNIPKRFLWLLFVIYQLLKNQKHYKIIHACDIDTALPAYFTKVFTRKKIVFDVFDWTSTEENKSIFGRVISKVENFIFKKSDYAILCEKYRINQVRKDARREFLVLPNIPDISYEKDNIIQETIGQQRQQYKTILSYVGVFDHNRGIEDILHVISENKNYCLNIAGFGHYEPLVKEMALKNENIVYWGKVDYNSGLNIMDNSDLIMAMYYMTNKVHKFAAPNKYYESLFLGKPILTNEGTLMAEKIMADNTGFVIKEGVLDIERFLTTDIEIGDLKIKSENAKTLWNSSFKDYTQKFMIDHYQEILK